MKTVILAPVHIYDDVRVFRKEAVTLAAAGQHVTLYARTPDDEACTRDGVHVTPVPKQSRPARFLNLARLGVAAWRERADVYHIHNPDTLPIGFALTALGKTVVYDTHEDFKTEILLRQWLPTPLRRVAATTVAALEALAGRCFAAVIVTQDQLRGRIPQAIVIGNPPIFDEARSQAFIERRADAVAEESHAGLTLGYIGGLSRDRGLDRMLDLLGALQQYGPTQLVLAGPAVNDDALTAARKRPEWTWVDYRGPLPQEEAFATLLEADVGLILFEDSASHQYVDPNKIYEYLSLALPFVATGFRSWRQRFVGEDVGLFIDPTTPIDRAAPAVHAFSHNRRKGLERGRRGVRFIADHYSWQSEGAPALLALYSRLSKARNADRTQANSHDSSPRTIRSPEDAQS